MLLLSCEVICLDSLLRKGAAVDIRHDYADITCHFFAYKEYGLFTSLPVYLNYLLSAGGKFLLMCYLEMTESGIVLKRICMEVTRDKLIGWRVWA